MSVICLFNIYLFNNGVNSVNCVFEYVLFALCCIRPKHVMVLLSSLTKNKQLHFVEMHIYIELEKWSVEEDGPLL